MSDELTRNQLIAKVEAVADRADWHLGLVSDPEVREPVQRSPDCIFPTYALHKLPATD